MGLFLCMSTISGAVQAAAPAEGAFFHFGEIFRLFHWVFPCFGLLLLE